MIAKRIFLGTGAMVLCTLVAGGGPEPSESQLQMLHDPSGWEYVTISDTDSGVQTTHTCFDGHPHPEECSGTLSFTSGGTFVQKVHIHGQTVQRHGNYELTGNQLALFDELGTKDGPYTIQIDTRAKSLVLAMPQVHIELELEKQYREDLRKAKEQASGK